jgi:hypothetical protein
MELVRQVIRKSLLVVVPVSIASFFYFDKKVFTGLVSGWLIGIINLRQLTKNLQNFLGSTGARFKIIFLSILRLSILFIVIFLLVYERIVNIFGLVAGFTIVFVFLILEGFKTAQRQ